MLLSTIIDTFLHINYMRHAKRFRMASPTVAAAAAMGKDTMDKLHLRSVVACEPRLQLGPYV